MSTGGGFCERHGPFDPPHTVCPFCQMEAQQRRAYGPPPATAPAAPRSTGTVPHAPEPAPAAGAAPRPPAVVEKPGEPDEASLTALARESEVIAALEAENLAGIGAPPQPLGWLIVRQPLEQRGTVLPVRANQIIGREGDVRWEDPGLSRQHARLTLEPLESAPDGPPVFHLWPFGPTNPVFVNGEPIRGATPLNENDEIRLGTTLFVFKVLPD